MLSNRKVEDFVKRGQENRPERDSSIYDKYFRKLSKYVSMILIRARFTPNMVTVTAMISGLVGCVLLALDNKSAYVTGACLILIFFLLDYCDGEVARYLDRQTMSGNYLDYFAHFVMFGGIFVGLTCGIYKHNPSMLVLFIGMLGIGGIYIRSLASVLIWEVICVEDLRRNKRLSTSNPDVTYKVKYQDVANDEPIEKTRPLSTFRKVVRLVLRPSGGDDIFLFFFPVAIVNCFIPSVVFGKWVVGFMDAYFLYLCSVNIAIAVFLVSRNVLKGRVELRYKEFFEGKQGKMKR